MVRQIAVGLLGLALTAMACTQAGADTPFPPKTVDTTPIRMTGQRPAAETAGPDPSAGFQPKTVQTAAIHMSGQRQTVEAGPDLSAGFTPRTIPTQTIRMSGQRP